jgi:hypothetical protein
MQMTSRACAIVLLLLSACTGGAAATDDRDGGMSTEDAGGPDGCAACTGDQICVAGRCQDLPRGCPCPGESYCELASNTCKAGCLEDAGCSAGRICDTDRRQCRAGCRMDGQCARGQICEGTTCRAGCRGDTACAAGEICDRLSCRAGCRDDGDCAMSGSICDRGSLTCKTGCRKDEDCGAGAVCDGATLMCRPGCRMTAQCPKEQVCDPMQSKCVAGCDKDDRCNTGRICEMSACVDGCRTSDTCAVGSYCNTMMKKCLPGCNGDRTRCAVGEACVRLVNGSYRCDAKCYGWDCNGTGWECFASYTGTSYDYPNARCRKECTGDAGCAMGERCTVFTSRPAVPGMNQVRYCARPCAMAGCTGALDGYAMSGNCTCAGDGACKTDMGMGYVCYQPSPSYGL